MLQVLPLAAQRDSLIRDPQCYFSEAEKDSFYEHINEIFDQDEAHILLLFADSTDRLTKEPAYLRWQQENLQDPDAYGWLLLLSHRSEDISLAVSGAWQAYLPDTLVEQIVLKELFPLLQKDSLAELVHRAMDLCAIHLQTKIKEELLQEKNSEVSYSWNINMHYKGKSVPINVGILAIWLIVILLYLIIGIALYRRKNKTRKI